MTISGEQLEQIRTIIHTALPGERMANAHRLAGNRVRIVLAGGEQLDLHTFDTQASAANAVAALRRLRAEIDLPIPALRASDSAGEFAGRPCLLASALDGEPLGTLVARIPEEQLHLIGQRIGEVVYRVHRIACAAFGPLVGEQDMAGEQAYVLGRLAGRLSAAQAAQIFDQAQAQAVQEWFERHFQPIGGTAALVCGNLSPETLLVRRSGEGWSLGGVLGWEYAEGWSPAWDHTVLFESARDTRYFALRVGYGKAYDELTARAYEQVREGAMRPYRMVYALEQTMAALSETEQQRWKRVVLAMVQIR